MRLRFGSFNIPDGAKISTSPDGRIKVAASQVNSSNLDIIGFQELVGRKGSDKPSDWAAKMLKALGDEWRIYVPTTSLNENYIFYRPARVTLAHGLGDLVLKSKAGGRHLTRAVFRHVDGPLFWFGNTHLVDGKANAASRTEQINQLAEVLPSSMPYLLVGDMNRSDTIAKFGVRFSPSRGATYTKYGAATRSTDPNLEYDHLYASAGSRVLGFNLVGVNGLQWVGTPRPSDHLLTIGSVEITGLA